MAEIRCTPGQEAPGRAVFSWSPVAAGDTCTVLELSGARQLAGSAQLAGSGGALSLEVSNDGVTFFSMKDMSGTAISATGAAFFEFTTSARYIRPAPATGLTGGAVTLCLRG